MFELIKTVTPLHARFTFSPTPNDSLYLPIAGCIYTLSVHLDREKLRENTEIPIPYRLIRKAQLNGEIGDGFARVKIDAGTHPFIQIVYTCGTYAEKGVAQFRTSRAIYYVSGAEIERLYARFVASCWG